MDQLGKSIGKSLIKSQLKSHLHKGDKSHEKSHGSSMSSSEFLKEAKQFAKTKDVRQIDPRALEYAATKIQAGWKGYKVRKAHE